MRTNIVIDDALMKKALQLTHCKTKREVVEEGLKILIRLKQQRNAFKRLSARNELVMEDWGQVKKELLRRYE